jgi:hypothetical protein
MPTAYHATFHAWYVHTSSKYVQSDSTLHIRIPIHYASTQHLNFAYLGAWPPNQLSRTYCVQVHSLFLPMLSLLARWVWTSGLY